TSGKCAEIASSIQRACAHRIREPDEARRAATRSTSASQGIRPEQTQVPPLPPQGPGGSQDERGRRRLLDRREGVAQTFRASGSGSFTTLHALSKTIVARCCAV